MPISVAHLPSDLQAPPLTLRPAHATMVRMIRLSRWREYYNPLHGLTMARLVSMSAFATSD